MSFENISLEVLLLFGAPLLALATWGVAKLNQLVKAKIKNEYWSGVLARLNDAVFTAVKSVHQSFVDPLKKENGGLTDENKAIAKKMAVETAKSYIGAKGLQELAKVFGLGADETEQMINDKVEAAVSDIKKSE